MSNDPASNIADQLAEMIKNESLNPRTDFNLFMKIDEGKHNSSYSANSMIRFNVLPTKSNRLPTAKSASGPAGKGGTAPRTPKEAQSALRTAAGGSDAPVSGGP